MTTNPINVLVVDDEKAIREMIITALTRAGMAARGAKNGTTAWLKINDHKPDILLLDWMMPGISGPELTRRVRKTPLTADIPVIMLTAKVSEDDKVAGLNAGADDYIVKPFSPRELVARINAILRRSAPGDQEGKIRSGNITMDTASRQVLFNETPVHIGPTEYRLLEFFMTHAKRAHSRSQLLDQVWGTNAFLEERTVDVHIRRLRKILAEADLDHYIQTVRSHGYRFVAEDARDH